MCKSDFYVANRGDNSILRMRQDGTVLSRREVRLDGKPLGAMQLNGIATSPDGTKIWVTLSGPVPGMGNPQRRSDGAFRLLIGLIVY